MSENIEKKLDESFLPFVALVGYANKGDFNDESMYFEMHKIDKNGKMRNGTPLTAECMSDLAKAFKAEQSLPPHGRIPSNMLYYDSRIGGVKYIWYNPPQKRMMYFSKNLKINDGEYYMPGVVYCVHGDRLHIYSFKGNKPIKKLFKAPFFNVSETSVCIGNAQIERPENPTFKEFIEYWEKQFWLTEFSHIGANPIKGNLVLITKASKETFDCKHLVSLSTTLQDILR